MHKNIKPSRFKVSALAIALAMLPIGANAAGLGKLSVLSAIGQPLRAELDISATKEELSSLTVRVAPPDAFNQAGIQYASVLSGLAFVLDKRADGRPYYRVNSDRPVNDPFLDMLIELNWASGRLVREYTFLLDPPEAFQKQPPVAPAVVAPEAKPEPAAAVDRAPSAARSAAPTAGGNERAVKPGDTLGKIAIESRPEGVSLDQMLLALFRSNEDAFIEGNMNRLKAGKILKIPSPEAATAIDAKEARKTVVAHAADFDAYRKKLAAAVAGKEAAKEEAPTQAAAGKITPKVEDKVPAPAPGKDKLQVSRTEAAQPGAKGGKAAGASVEDDRIAKEKALKEANARIAELEKNLSDLKKLAELKSQAGADLQKQAQAPKPAAEPPRPEPVPAKPVDAARPAETEKSAEAAKSEEAPKPAETAKPPEAPKPVEPAKKPVPPPPPPPPPEPSFIDDNPEIVFGGGGLLALLLGYLGFSAWRKKKALTTDESGSGSELSPTSAFGTTAGEASITGGGPVLTDFSQAALGTLGADEGVDPVAEADVYMAYGREAQAEEILIEALKTDPTRHAIYLKLLELYSKRKSARQFETLARELHGLTSGAGSDWEKAAAMGLALDPTNPLYGGESPRAPAAPETAPAAMASGGDATPEEARTVVQSGGMPMSPEAEVPPEEEVSGALDFDFDAASPEGVTAAPATVIEIAPSVPEAAEAEEEAMSLDFDLDLGTPAESAPEASAEVPPAVIESPDDGNTIDFELGGAPEATLPDIAVEAAPEALSAAGAGGGGLDFDFDLGAGGEAPVSAAEAAPAPALDLASISLDLEAPLPAAEPEMASAELEPPVVADNPEVGTKLELAIAYEEMGDKEGARELLQEVLSEGSPAQQEKARDKLARLDS